MWVLGATYWGKNPLRSFSMQALYTSQSLNCNSEELWRAYLGNVTLTYLLLSSAGGKISCLDILSSWPDATNSCHYWQICSRRELQSWHTAVGILLWQNPLLLAVGLKPLYQTHISREESPQQCSGQQCLSFFQLQRTKGTHFILAFIIIQQSDLKVQNEPQ